MTRYHPVKDYRAAYAHPDFVLEDDIEIWLTLSGAQFLDVRGLAPEFWWQGHDAYYLSITVHSRQQLRDEVIARRYRVIFMEIGTGRHLVDLNTDSLSICQSMQMLYTENLCRESDEPSDASSSTRSKTPSSR